LVAESSPELLDALDRELITSFNQYFWICASRMPLEKEHSLSIRIGHYRSDYRLQRDGTVIEFPDSTSFPSPALLIAPPKSYRIGPGEPEISFSLKYVHRPGGGVPGIPPEVVNQIREKAFYTALNRYLFEKGLDVDVKAGPELVEAVTRVDFEAFLRRYLLGRFLTLSLPAVVALTLVVFHPIMALAALPSLFFAHRIMRKVSQLRKAITQRRVGEYFLRRLRDSGVMAPQGAH
jgi:hypothetical protein